MNCARLCLVENYNGVDINLKDLFIEIHSKMYAYQLLKSCVMDTPFDNKIDFDDCMKSSCPTTPLLFNCTEQHFRKNYIL